MLEKQTNIADRLLNLGKYQLVQRLQYKYNETPVKNPHPYALRHHRKCAILFCH